MQLGPLVCESESPWETLIMVVTVATHNLAVAVGVGVLTAMAVFARRVAHLVEVDAARAVPDAIGYQPSCALDV